MFLLHAIVTLHGEPHLFTTSTGKTRFSLRGFFKDRKKPSDNPEDSQTFTWVNIQIWAGRYDKLIPHLKHGSKIFVAGAPYFQPYRDNRGESAVSIYIAADHVSIIQFPPRPNEESNTQDRPSLQHIQEPTFTQDVPLPVREDDQGSFSSDWGF